MSKELDIPLIVDYGKELDNLSKKIYNLNAFNDALDIYNDLGYNTTQFNDIIMGSIYKFGLKAKFVEFLENELSHITNKIKSTTIEDIKNKIEKD